VSDAPVNSAPPLQKQATAAQLRRMVKSRPYLPVHEIRRTYGLPGDEDLTVKIYTADGEAWIGLPDREAKLIEVLVRQGEVGLIFHDMPRARVVLGIYGMTLHA
jgi:hypothetical protein